jgi:hypothetical protein
MTEWQSLQIHVIDPLAQFQIGTLEWPPPN